VTSFIQVYPTERWFIKLRDSLYISLGYIRIRVQMPWAYSGVMTHARPRDLVHPNRTECPTYGTHIDGEGDPWYDHDHTICLGRWPNSYEAM
jgi:hypothetical protein